MTSSDSPEEGPPEGTTRGRPPPRPRLDDDDLAVLDAIVEPADRRMAALYPGDRPGRQPVHTVYLPADRMRPDVSPVWGRAALDVLNDHAPNGKDFAAALHLQTEDGRDLEIGDAYDLMLDKLDQEPIEDLRIDFEDGYAVDDGEQEDRDAVAAAKALGVAIAEDMAPPFCGIRFKAFEARTRRRGLRTLDLFLGTLLDSVELPPGWVATLPKVTSVEQVEAMVEVCARLETEYGLAMGRLQFEVQIETAQAILAADGTTPVARLVHAGGGRVSGLHFGTYDFTAGLGIAPAHQSLDHPVALHAKVVMALAAAQTGVRVSDGSLNRVPVGTRSQVRDGWARHAATVQRQLQRGLYQGWDLHWAQLPTRFAATFLFFRAGLPEVLDRLAAYFVPDEDSELGYVDEPATAQALAALVVRGLDCGAVDTAEVSDLDISVDELRRLAARRFG